MGKNCLQLEQCYVYTDYITGYNLDSSKNYYIMVFSSKEDAIKELNKRFSYLLGKTSLKDKDKEKILKRFKVNIEKGDYSFHFRDNRDPEEPQFFGKVHKRSVLWKERRGNVLYLPKRVWKFPCRDRRISWWK